MNNSLSQDYIDEFLLVKDSEGISQRTYREYQYNHEKFKQFLREDELTNLKVNEFLVWLKNKGAGDFYRHNNARTIKTFMKYMAKQYDFPNPYFAMPIIHKKKKLYLEFDQIQSLLKSDLSDREIIIIRLLISTGIRLS